ncbi:hypothetical protein EH240_09200 [Mesorhizobium tamadayense]|uniref:Uncharacterized protein n=1 Tax=Mesorhizobium tamadayense TaxID=425306 RepID=A0A3P3FZ58_9HYPH|nr:hypothetical protein [Mesorhizobium tamadayense]RRI03871.1 hypothetical protein EH240_09200 [Mesorhizobium tamadayense]
MSPLLPGVRDLHLADSDCRSGNGKDAGDQSLPFLKPRFDARKVRYCEINEDTKKRGDKIARCYQPPIGSHSGTFPLQVSTPPE